MAKIPFKVVANEPVIVEVEKDGQVFQLVAQLAIVSVDDTGRAVAGPDPLPEFSIGASFIAQTRRK